MYGGYGKFFSCTSIFRADDTLPSSPMMLKSTARCIARNPSEKYPIRTQKRLEFVPKPHVANGNKFVLRLIEWV